VVNKTVPIFKALADPTRFRIVDLLLTHDLCVGALASRLGISKAAVSQHIQVLRKAGLVRGEKRGEWTHYTVERKALHSTAQMLIQAADKTIPPERTCARIASQITSFSERREIDMCKDCCEHPEKLEGKPENCSPEQVKECHGETLVHPCEGEKK